MMNPVLALPINQIIDRFVIELQPMIAISLISNNFQPSLMFINMSAKSKGMKCLPIGVPGELYISGPSLALGYLNRNDLTQERFVDNPYFDPKTMNIKFNKLYKTGDLARWCDDGTIEFLGRSDHQVKIRGFRIELSEIESQIRMQLGVQNCIMKAFKDQHGEYLVAYMVPSSNTESIGVSEVRARLGKNLPLYMLPSVVFNVDSIPLLPNGKVNEKLLPFHKAI